MEVAQYKAKVDVIAGPGMYAQDYVELLITKEPRSTRWIVTCPGVAVEWKFDSLETAEELLKKELVPLIQAHFNTKAQAEFAQRELEKWKFDQFVIHRTTSVEPAKVDA